jgi:hypothetical protein
LEDWSGIESLCAACSEGRPHQHGPPTQKAWHSNRRFGIAAVGESVVLSALQEWSRSGTGREVRALACALPRP